MASKNKLKKFNDLKDFKNVLEPSRDLLIEDKFKIKGKWLNFFKNNNPIILELACGKGEYSYELAKLNPYKNFIGIDIKGSRIWSGAKKSLENKVENLFFIRAHIELLNSIFAYQEVSEIWITFPDPNIKFKRIKHCLLNNQFLEIYKKVLKVGGLIHLKTDSEFLYGYVLGILSKNKSKIHYAHHDIYSNRYSPDESINIQTHYEMIFLKEKKAIKYLKFEL